jgi:hypothetical protein
MQVLRCMMGTNNHTCIDVAQMGLRRIAKVHDGNQQSYLGLHSMQSVRMFVSIIDPSHWNPMKVGQDEGAELWGVGRRQRAVSPSPRMMGVGKRHELELRTTVARRCRARIRHRVDTDNGGRGEKARARRACGAMLRKPGRRLLCGIVDRDRR